MRIFAISDLHTDFDANWQLVRQLPDRSFKKDALIVAGDIADRLEIIHDTLSLLRSKFSRVFYVPGNHELWVRTEPYHSVEKFARVLEVCDRLDIQTRPAQFHGVWIVPLFSWYDSAFDPEPQAYGLDLPGWADFHLCQWPEAIGPVCQYFIQRNEPVIQAYPSQVISFSHFLPRRELLPPREMLQFKDLPKVSGCQLLEGQIRRLNSIAHVFGHSHINRDVEIDGIRYIQNALSYPRERSTSHLPLKVIWESDSDGSRLGR